MNLTKLLRKYTKTLLMVFMSLLLVAFLIPSSVQSCGQQNADRIIATGEAFGKRIPAATITRARSDLRLLSSAGFPAATAFSPVQYYLLSEEARRAGVKIGNEEVKALLAGSGRTDAHMQAWQRQTRLSYDQIYEIISRYLAVIRLTNIQATADFESLPRQELEYRNMLQEAVADISVIDARAFVHLVPEPTEEQLQAFLDEHKENFQAHTETALAFGYRLPDRVRVETLTVDPQSALQEIRVKGKQVRDFFEQNARFYTKPDPLATQPTQGPPPRVPMTFEEAQDRVREDFRELRAIEEAQTLVNKMFTEANRSWAIMPVGEDGFTEVPDAEPVSFQDLQKRYSRNYEVTYEQSELLDLDDLRAFGGLGSAGLGQGAQRITAPQVALRVKGILDENPGDGIPVVQPFEPAPVMLTSRRNRLDGSAQPYQAYLFRVTEVAPNAPPESIDDVREALTRDWKLSQAYELAREHAEKLATRAREIGLTAAVAEAETLKAILKTAEERTAQETEGTIAEKYLENLEPTRPARLSRSIRFIRPLGQVTNVQEAIFELDATPATGSAPAHRVGKIPVASQFKWAVAELIEVKPLYEGGFIQRVARQNPNYGRFIQAWASAENVRERTAFKPAPDPRRPPPETDEPDDTAAPDAPAEP
jgi:hypothetical protein